VADTRACLVTGGTGLVGGHLLRSLASGGTPVRALTRRPDEASLPPGVEAIGWDGTQPPREALAGTRAAVHLAGEPIFGGRLDEKRKTRVRKSRIESTRALVETLGRLPAAERPRCLVCASAVGIYGDAGEAELPEDAPTGKGFLAEVCRDWEAAALAAREQDVRVVCLRFGIVLARSGGALAQMLLPFRLGLGGPLGDGRQWMPWIHLIDAVSLIVRALDDDGLAGPVNATSPAPVRNVDFTRALAAQLSRPAVLRLPAFVLRLALGDLAIELLGSRRTVPRAALEAGFTFAYPDIEDALAAELSG